ncbi:MULTISPECIES: dynamin family protein [Campylobacter]|uniref:dynamin family protein n=1 Tax=Campylobacter TaxID=194 RepID=UPI00127367FE|nr:dynamin family protein [Campylobacter lari]MBT0815254.1 dynamin family protein [Campylobacter lari]MCR8676940.1 dynamin family protein [Campylobacter sp. S4:11]
MKEQLNQFYHDLEELSIIGTNLLKKREQVENCVKDFKENCVKINIDQLEAKNQEIGEFLKQKLDSIHLTISNWENEILKLSNEDKFRDELENNFIVIIYGKVKAGKSTLGNFVASNCLENQKSYFKVYDKTGKEKESEKLEEIQEFKTDITECTSSIQLFKLGGKDENGGIAWVDTPGLLSTTEENGNLAKQYIEAADYIIFPTSSDAPLQNDEIEQIKELVNSGKGSALRLIITKSDKTTQDEVDGKIVTVLENKKEEDRKEQEEYVLNTTKEKIPNLEQNEKIMSISVFTAQEGIKTNNTELFKNSNIEKFYNSMSLVLTKKAQKLKEEVPQKRLNFLIDYILEKSSAKEDYQALNNLIEEKKREGQIIQSNLNREISLLLYKELTTIVNELDEINTEMKFKNTAKTIAEKVNNQICSEINKLVNDFVMRFDIIAPALDSKIEAKYRTYKYTIPRGFFEKVLNICSFGVFYKEETTNKKIKAGDNRSELIEKNIQLLKKHYEEVVDESIKTFYNDVLNPCEKIVHNLERNLLTLENNLLKLKGE